MKTPGPISQSIPRPTRSTSLFSGLEEKLGSRQAEVAILGLGYVGLPLAVFAAGAGFPVLGLDTDDRKIEAMVSGDDEFCSTIPGAAELLASGGLSVTSDLSRINGADVIVICVPTPLTANQVPEMAFIRKAAADAAASLKPGALVILESTTYPGCTRDELLPELEGTGLRVGEDFWLAFSPERVNPGDPVHDISNTPKLVGGMTPDCGEMASLFYRQFIDEVFAVNSAETAEMAKLLENVYRSVNIALVNELAVICNGMGVNVWEVIEAAATKPFGFTPFYPGPGLGGHCIPIDPFYLSWKAKELGLATEFIELAGKINTRMPRYVVERVSQALNTREKCLRGSTVILVGAAYKAGVPDLRESPAIRIAELLLESGARVSYHDPYVSCLKVNGAELDSTGLDAAAVGEADCVVVVTAHDNIDWEALATDASLIVDTRNVVPPAAGRVFSI